MSAATQYDIMGHSFVSYQYTPSQKVQMRNMMRLIGDVRGKDILDLACGYGFLSLEMKKSGADTVAGMDISAKMLDMAREQAQQADCAVDYYLGDAASRTLSRQFDVVTAVYLFNYAKTEAELTAMFKNAARHLRSGGRLIACVPNPAYQLTQDVRDLYNVEILSHERLSDDVYKYRVSFDGTAKNAFLCFQWSQRAYEAALRQAGFTKFSWHMPELLAEDTQNRKAGFAEAYLKNCIYTYLICMF